MSDQADLQNQLTTFTGRAAWHASLVRAFRLVLVIWPRKSRGRAQLLDLDDHLLEDIGVSRSEARREAYRPFWY